MKTNIVIALMVAVAIVERLPNSKAIESEEKLSGDAIKQAQIEYLQTILKNCQADFDREATLNKPAVYNPMIVRERRLCDFAELCLKSLSDPSSDSVEQGIAKKALASLESELEKQVKVDSLVPTNQSKADVDRLRRQVELARERLKILRAMEHASVEQRLEWALMLQTERDCIFGFYDGYL